ncbi:MAG: hypothetical protein C0606_02650 [Hyphomicrobiales bacterium]|nr:MAG: hypothetical protein C0606_02650 [Hyphomicrobiales bacterium]
MRRGLITGLVGWLLATILFRMIGAPVLSVGAYFYTFAVGGLAVAILALVLCRLLCQPGKVARFGAGLVIPGLLGDAAAVLAFGSVFPTVSLERADEFGALMLWGYAIILATIVLLGDKVVRQA